LENKLIYDENLDTKS